MFTLVNLTRRYTHRSQEQALAPPEDVFQHVAFGAAAGAKLLPVRGETLAGRGIGLQNGPSAEPVMGRTWWNLVKHMASSPMEIRWNKECTMTLYNQ